MKIQEIHQHFLRGSGVSTDSRTIRKGQLFFALSGENFDGNRFVQAALDAGCSVAICTNSGMADDPRVIVVQNALQTLQQLATYHRMQWKGTMFAITGSNGKTTTKELALEVLSRKFSVLATEGNLNNHIGVPLTLLNLTDQEVAVIEMGANHQREIAELCEIARPDVGLITNIGKAHLEGFGGIEGVRKGKGELYDFLLSSGGTALVNMSSGPLKEMIIERGMEPVAYGVPEGLVEGDITDVGEHLKGNLRIKGDRIPFETNLIGSYNLQNILSAAAIGTFLEVEPHAIVAAIKSYLPENNRSQLIQGKTNRIILDAYNANPTSMEGALRSLSTSGAGPKAVILGEMLEVGNRSGEEHEKVLEQLIAMEVELACLVGDQFFQLKEKWDHSTFHFYKTTELLLKDLEHSPLFGYTILVKGSRKNRLERTTNLLSAC